ncbi:MAG: TenA family transcriptional regulator [Cyanobacteria bacterium P01_F01_bin.143]
MTNRSSRSPRRIDFQHSALSQQTFSIDPPSENSISWKLWLACQDIADQALASKYIQGIKNGNLHPDRYGQYTVQDAVYCHNAQTDYQIIKNRKKTDDLPELKAFAEARFEGYQKYNKQFLESWHIDNVKALAPSSVVNTYIDFERKVAQNMPPIYGIIAMIPCEELWSWLATQLKPYATPQNLYSFWIAENDGWHGTYRLDNFIDSWFAKHPDVFKWETALYVMRSCMTCEVNFFLSAFEQPLLPMPLKPESTSS